MIGWRTSACSERPGGHSDLGPRLNNLGCILCCRYERTNNVEDLEDTIRVAHHAVKITPEKHAV